MFFNLYFILILLFINCTNLVFACDLGYYLSNSECLICPPGYTCNGYSKLECPAARYCSGGNSPGNEGRCPLGSFFRQIIQV